MSQILQTDEYEKFIHALTEIGKYDYGKPLKEYPRFTSFQKKDPKFPTDSILERGPKAIRSYWNMKNLRRRKK